METFMQSVFAFLNRAKEWLYTLAGDVLSWIGSWFLPLWDELESEPMFGLWVFLICLGLVAAGIGSLFTYGWVSERRKKIEEELAASSSFYVVTEGIGIFSLVLYAVLTVWLVAIGSADGTNTYSHFWVPQDVEMGFDTFPLWLEALKIPTVFVLARFAFSIVGSVLSLNPLGLLRSVLITLACIALGYVGGRILTLVNNLAASNFLMMVVTMPVFFCVYLLPWLFFWIPALAPLAVLVGVILAPFFAFVGDYAPPKEEVELEVVHHVDLEHGIVRTVVGTERVGMFILNGTSFITWI